MSPKFGSSFSILRKWTFTTSITDVYMHILINFHHIYINVTIVQSTYTYLRQEYLFQMTTIQCISSTCQRWPVWKMFPIPGNTPTSILVNKTEMETVFLPRPKQQMAKVSWLELIYRKCHSYQFEGCLQSCNWCICYIRTSVYSYIRVCPGDCLRTLDYHVKGIW